ncbi:MAG: hypothetical protein HY875_09130 [Chloroflexi bacterium]|nr:hypothetical protein [Chloroflexota bacterium]
MKRHYGWFGIFALLVLALAAACGGGGDDDSDSDGGDAGSPSGTAAPGKTTDGSKATATSKSGSSTAGKGCDLTITGDKEISVKTAFSATGSGAGTDYWISDDEMRAALLALVKAGNAGISDADAKKKVDEEMKNDPRIFLLIVNCVAPKPDDVSISFLPGGDSKYADVPFGSKKYTIAAGGTLGGDVKPGQFSVLFTIGDHFFNVAEDGQLNITKFDASGIAGTFSFSAKENEFLATGTPLKVKVEGKFDYPCTGGSKCKN